MAKNEHLKVKKTANTLNSAGGKTISKSAISAAKTAGRAAARANASKSATKKTLPHNPNETLKRSGGGTYKVGSRKKETY